MGGSGKVAKVLDRIGDGFLLPKNIMLKPHASMNCGRRMPHI
jgi:hypothetical protein